jgi:hypothetical protein
MAEQDPLAQIAPIPDSYRYRLVTILRIAALLVKKASDAAFPGGDVRITR